MEGRQEHWWGEFDLAQGATKRAQIGPLVLWLQRLSGELIIGRESLPRSPDDVYPPPSVRASSTREGLFELEALDRFALSADLEPLVMMPALADRPVITSPRKPLHILPRSEATIFASSPLWLDLRCGTFSLIDLAVDQPADTWFGPTTLRGETCYATRAFCRLRLEEIQTPLHRAVTAITIHNRTESALHLKRMKVPAPNLGLYAEPGGRLWTEDVTFERVDEDEGFASLHVAHSTPRYAERPERISDPREEADDLITRAFGSIFSRSSG
jgi:hypothetical protein